jgi:hypothetical protein
MKRGLLSNANDDLVAEDMILTARRTALELAVGKGSDRSMTRTLADAATYEEWLLRGEDE